MTQDSWSWGMIMIDAFCEGVLCRVMRVIVIVHQSSFFSFSSCADLSLSLFVGLYSSIARNRSGRVGCE